MTGAGDVDEPVNVRDASDSDTVGGSAQGSDSVDAGDAAGASDPVGVSDSVGAGAAVGASDPIGVSDAAGKGDAAPAGDELDAAIARGYAERDRENMEPTIAYFRAMLDEHPDDARVLYEVGGAYDTAGEEEIARGYYERALARGLTGDTLRRCLLQYGSTLRNLGLFDDSLAALERARREFPDSDAMRLFHALSLHAASRSDAAVAELLILAADRIDAPDVRRYEAALRGNADYLATLDSLRPRGME